MICLTCVFIYNLCINTKWRDVYSIGEEHSAILWELSILYWLHWKDDYCLKVERRGPCNHQKLLVVLGLLHTNYLFYKLEFGLNKKGFHIKKNQLAMGIGNNRNPRSWIFIITQPYTSGITLKYLLLVRAEVSDLWALLSVTDCSQDFIKES